MISRFLLVAALGLATAGLSRAAVTLGARDNIQLGGFFSQGYLKSNGNNYPVENRDGTFEFREMAVNVSTTLGSRLRVGAQAFAQRIGNFGNDKVLLDWAVADFNVRQEFGIRVGRVKYPKGLYGEALDLDVVRPFVFLPLAIYNPVLRDFSASFDGAMVYGTLGAKRFGSFDYKIFHGDIPVKPEQGVADFFSTTGLFATPGVTRLALDHVSGGQLMWTTPVSGLRLGGSWSGLRRIAGFGRFAYAPVNVSVVGNRYTYTTYSAEYVRGDWTFAGEWQRTGDSFITTSTAPSRPSRNGADAFYVSAARRVNRWLEVGTYFSRSENRFASATATRAQRQIDDSALSLRFDINEHVVCKLEGHYVDGVMGLFNTARVPNPPASRRERTTVIAAKTTVSF